MVSNGGTAVGETLQKVTVTVCKNIVFIAHILSPKPHSWNWVSLCIKASKTWENNMLRTHQHAFNDSSKYTWLAWSNEWHWRSSFRWAHVPAARAKSSDVGSSASRGSSLPLREPQVCFGRQTMCLASALFLWNSPTLTSRCSHKSQQGRQLFAVSNALHPSGITKHCTGNLAARTGRGFLQAPALRELPNCMAGTSFAPPVDVVCVHIFQILQPTWGDELLAARNWQATSLSITLSWVLPSSAEFCRNMLCLLPRMP